jgi:alginate O-acetyltransferase complex protein AlgI
LVFSNPAFLFFFLPATIALYALVPARLRNTFLLTASLVFYTWGAGEFVVWLIASILGNWFFALLAAPRRPGARSLRARLAVSAAVVTNVSLLAYFKYANFFVQEVLDAGDRWEWQTVALPIGISFFTFQGMSYLIDVSRGTEKPLRNPLDVALYVACFPQLIAGPIIRYGSIASQIHQRELSWSNFATGSTRFALGLSKKILVADSVAPVADAAFGASATLSAPDAWIGIAAYTVQIYFDFSGYSDMAIGIGRILGFRFPENFRRPYSAVSVTDYWRRWHITLSSWFRDYVFVSLGGSRGSRPRTLFNLCLIFVAAGIWHGANWTFLGWGLFHGFAMVLERLTGLSNYRPSGRTASAVSRIGCLFFVMMSLVLFRAESLSQAGSYYQALVGALSFDGTGAAFIEMDIQFWLAFSAGVAACFLPGKECTGAFLERSHSAKATALAYAIALVALPLSLVLAASGAHTSFLYFRF